MTTPAQAFAYRVSEKAQYAELRVQRAFGEDWTTAYTEAWRIMDEVYDLAMAPDRPAFHEAPRMIFNPNSTIPKELWS